MEQIKQANRIQTSILNAAEKKALVWMAERMPKWVNSNMLTGIGTFGALVIAAGYILSNLNLNYIWLASFGLLINWFGDSLDGTLARVRNTQRPVFGYYLDHTMDVFNEFFMFIGVGLSAMMHLYVVIGLYIIYILLTLNVSINAHLRREFRITYAKLGPTEFRIIAIIINTIWILVPAVREYSRKIFIFGNDFTIGIGDYIGLGLLVVLLAIYISTVISDIKYYSKLDPAKKQ